MAANKIYLKTSLTKAINPEKPWPNDAPWCVDSQKSPLEEGNSLQASGLWGNFPIHQILQAHEWQPQHQGDPQRNKMTRI